MSEKFCRNCRHMRKIKFIDTGEEDMLCNMKDSLVADDPKYGSAIRCPYYGNNERDESKEGE